MFMGEMSERDGKATLVKSSYQKEVIAAFSYRFLFVTVCQGE